MDFTIPEELTMLQSTVRKFVEEELQPIEMQVPGGNRLPEPHWTDLCNKAKALGLWALDAPEEYGGGGVSTLGMTLVHQERCKTTAGIGVFGSAGPNILYEGTTEQIEKYLKPVIRGEKRSFFAQTEPHTGSDPASLATRALLEGDHYIINGGKTFISDVGGADFGLVFAKTDTARGRAGVTCFIVESGTPGFKVIRQIPTLHSMLDAFELAFDDVRVPVANRLGEEGQGFALGQRWLGRNRLMFGARHVGVAERLIPMAARYAKMRVTFGQPIAARQAIQWMLADAWTWNYAMRNMVRHAAWMYDRGDDSRQEIAAVKAFVCDFSFRTIDNIMQIFGAVGTSTDLPIERYWRQARHTRIAEGTTEMMKFIIARNILRD